MYDLLICGGTVVDGTGAKGFVCDVAIKDGKIAKIAADITEPAAKKLDARGLVVSPGFIDAHSHSDNCVLFGFDGYNFLEQGITTQVAGHCGTSPVPYYDGIMDDSKRFLSPEKWTELVAACDNFVDFMDCLSKMEMGTNMALYVGQGNLRGRVMGFSDATPTKAQLTEMENWMAQAMQCGYLGFSTGLVYAPSVYAGTEELIAIAKVVKQYGGSYTSHVRGEGNTVVQSVNEAIHIGEEAGVPVIISHLKVCGKQNIGVSTQLLKILEDANARGIKVRADQYPFIGGSAPLISQIPPKYATEGNDKLVENLKNPAVRANILDDIFNDFATFESSIYSAGFEGCLIAECAYTPQYVGKTIAGIAKDEGKEPIDVLCDILISNHGIVQGIYFSQNDEDMMRIISHPYVMGGTDWSNYVQHVDENQVAGCHPRGTSTMIKRLEIIRDNNLRTLEDSVHSITGLPAEMAGISSIGVLREGASADVCVFDYAKLHASADFIHPFKRNEGLHYVVVNGTVAVENGVYNGAKSGKVLKKG